MNKRLGGTARASFGSRQLTIVSYPVLLTPLCHSAIKGSTAYGA
jgi:hypothetical protein